MLLLVLAVATPVALLVLLLLMERVERPFRRAADGERVEEFLDAASPSDVDALARGGLRHALTRQRSQRRRRLVSRRV